MSEYPRGTMRGYRVTCDISPFSKMTRLSFCTSNCAAFSYFSNLFFSDKEGKGGRGEGGGYKARCIMSDGIVT